MSDVRRAREVVDPVLRLLQANRARSRTVGLMRRQQNVRAQTAGDAVHICESAFRVFSFGLTKLSRGIFWITKRDDDQRAVSALVVDGSRERIECAEASTFGVDDNGDRVHVERIRQRDVL